jgi:hypothetical protein
MTLEHGPNRTVLTGDVRDQAQLYGLIGRLQEFGIELLAVESADVSEDGSEPGKGPVASGLHGPAWFSAAAARSPRHVPRPAGRRGRAAAPLEVRLVLPSFLSNLHDQVLRPRQCGEFPEPETGTIARSGWMN